jgi:hypothetical protein
VFLTNTPNIIAIMIALMGLFLRLRSDAVHLVDWNPINVIKTASTNPGRIVMGFCIPNRRFKIFDSFFSVNFYFLSSLGD